MAKEAKKKCYGQWNFPAGHVEENELVTDAAIREAYEETGCKVKLTGVLPISTVYLKEKETDVKWLDLDEVKHMTEVKLRGYDTALKDIKSFEEKKI